MPTRIKLQPATIAIVVIVCAAFANIMLFASRRFVDDAFIYFRYVDNLLGGHGLTWNRGGELVEGYTSFLYVVVLVVPRWLGANLVDIAAVLNVALHLATIVCAAWLVRTVAASQPEPPPQRARGRLLQLSGFAGALVLAASGDHANPWDGMETELMAFMLVLSLAVYCRGRTSTVALGISGMLFGLTALARPEGILLYVACVGVALVAHVRSPEPGFLRNEGIRFLGVIAVVLPHLLWRHGYYGEWLPNTFYAKVSAPSLARVKTGIEGARALLGTLGGLTSALAFALWFVTPRTRLGNVLAALLVGFYAYLIYLGIISLDWHTRPVYLIGFLLFGTCFHQLVSHPPVGRHVVRVLVAIAIVIAGYMLAETSGVSGIDRAVRGVLIAATIALLVLQILQPNVRAMSGLLVGILVAVVGGSVYRPIVLAIQTRSFMGTAKGLDARPDITRNDFIPIGMKLREIAKSDDTVAVCACGAIPYYSGLVTYDGLGLNDHHIAHMPMPSREVAFGHDKGDGAYILAKRPTYLIPIPFLTTTPDPGRPEWSKSFVELFALPEFQTSYEFKSIQMMDGRYFNYYVLKR